MSDLTPPDPHAPAANDVSHSAMDAMKHHCPTCVECGRSPDSDWETLPNGKQRCANCKHNIMTGGFKP
jgi:hypothetical protein